ncbi:hypothetical protein [Ferrimonas senticii]|uniref:hypothetical protein n=1 Tax=Ferrimonas senticii TaxID=394566 RepID=UPI00040A1921|nr:hypothetical protein [Ferrimonas senticii]
MTSLLEKLSSMRLACVLIIASIVWFALGIFLSEQAGYWPVLKQLSGLPFSQWSPLLGDNPPVLWWLVSLVMVVALLGVNTLACSVTGLWPIWQKRRWRHRHLWLLPIHLLTLVIFCMHALEIVVLHQPTHIELKAGEQTEFNGHTVRLDSIEYNNDIGLIRQDAEGHTQAGRMTRRTLADFDPRINHANLSVFDADGKLLISDAASFMEPLEWGDHKAAAVDFFVPHGAADSALTVKFTLSHNPMAKIYFGSYILLILSLLIHQFHLLSGFARTERIS